MYRLPFLVGFIFLLVLKPTENFCQAPDSLTNKLVYIAIKRDLPAVQIGQIVPDTGLFRAVNYKDTLLRISDFRGRLLILDFWHKWCTTCIASFPRLQALQEKFGSRIMILPVTFQSRASVQAFQEKRKSINLEMKLPSVIEDTLLRKYFPHDGDPYEVWISPEGKVIGITEPDVISDTVLEETLSGNLTRLEKSKMDLSFDKERPLFIDQNGGADSNFLCRSLIAPFIPNIRVGGTYMVPQRWGKNWWFHNYNNTVINLIKWMLNRVVSEELSNDPLNKRLLLRTKRPGADMNNWNWPEKRMTPNEEELFMRNNCYSFDLIVPSSKSETEIYKESLEVLENFFNISVKVEKNSIPCLALVRTSGVDKIRAKGKEKPYVHPVDDGKIREVSAEHRPISEFILGFNCGFKLPWVVDGTHYENNVDIELNFRKETKYVSLKELRAALKKYDLDLIPTSRKLDMLVIEDRK